MGARERFGRKNFLLKRTAWLMLAAVITFSGMPGFTGTVGVQAEGKDETVTVYTVAPGDSLEKIANEFGITVEEIAAANNLEESDIIRVGQELAINAPVKERLRSNDISDRGSEPSSVTPSNATVGATAPAGTISINMSNMDIRDILSTIALNMGVNIVYIGDPVTVSFKVDNVSATKALDLLVQSVSSASGTLGYLRDGNIIIVGSQAKLQKDFFNKMALTRFRVNYIKPDVLSAQLDKLGIPIQKITLDRSSKYIWAQGLPQSLTKVAEVIAALDRAENFDADTTQLVASFKLTPYSLEYITADALNTLIGQLDLGVKTISVDTNPKVIWASGTAQDLKDLEQLIANIDVEESAGQTFDMEACRLTFITYNKLLPIVSQLDLPVQIIKLGTSQKALWLKGTEKDISDVKDLITKLDIKENSEQYQYFVYTLSYISPADAVAKLDFLAIGDVQGMALNYPNLAHEILIKSPQDMKSTVLDVLNSIDVAGKKIKVPVDSATGASAAYFLTNRKALLNKLLGIPLDSMFVSDNVTKSTDPYYVLWVEETPDKIKLIRSMITQIDSPQ